MSVTFLNGDVRKILPTLPDDSVDCIVTSPPYWGLRDYGNPGQIGLEQTMSDYLNEMVEVCQELMRVLKPEGTFWLNIGDTYASNRGGGAQPPQTVSSSSQGRPTEYCPSRDPKSHGLKNKDLCMIPNRLAILLQDNGWYVRSEIIWHKPNPMPESVKDRPTSCHEKVWLLTKTDKYYYNADAIMEDGVIPAGTKAAKGSKERFETPGVNSRPPEYKIYTGKRNARNVWSIRPKPFKGAHFATMPVELAEKCIKAGCPDNGTVLDPFGGAGTTGVAANLLGRNAILVELNPNYIEIAKQRIKPTLLDHMEK